MRIQSIKVENHRCFKEFEIDFDDNFTVIVAENGVGKTAILDAVAVAVGPFVGAFDTGVNKGFSYDDARLVIKEKTEQTNLMESIFPVKLWVKGLVSGQQEEWYRELSGKKSRTTIKDAHILQNVAKELQHLIRNEGEALAQVSLPVVSYYGTGRLWDQKQLPHTESKMTRSRLYGYSNALDPKSTYKHFAQWFRDVSRAQYDDIIKLIQSGKNIEVIPKHSESRTMDSVRKALNTCLQISGWCNLRYDFEFKELTADHPEQGTIPVSRLSDGVRNMLGMIADIAYRCTKLNPHLDDAPQETEGIVLIDEVDMHLHPKWQQTVVNDLRTAFPKIQFIVTTHSPQVLTTLKKDNIRIINLQEPQAFKATRSPLGHEPTDALAYIMNTNTRPNLEVLTLLQEYEQYVKTGKENTEKAIEIKKQIDKYGYEIDESMLEMWRFLANQSNKKD